MKDNSSGAVAPPNLSKRPTPTAARTAGPWRVEGPDPKTANRNMGLWSVESGTNVANFCTYADAHLIAASPDLLAAILAILPIADAYVKDFGGGLSPVGLELLSARIVEARAAIAKATQPSPDKPGLLAR